MTTPAKYDADTVVMLVYDHETGTVLAAEDCSVVTCTMSESEQLSEGTLDLETWKPRSIRPVLDDVQLLAQVEVSYPDGTIGRWSVPNGTADKVAELLGSPDTLRT